ncbi:MAG: sulfurtransferase [Acidiphilium sp.]|nr:sulfurtransferase [Acidiphilium sp.]MDD4935141.1 sulfurtransferase [Acidiphilium sp.]
MTPQYNDALVSTAWLAAHLTDPDLRILDCTWHHVSTHLDGRTQYRGRHLPGSVHFDIDHIADKTNPLPHMLPKPTEFADKVGLLGIGSGDRIVVYDRMCGGAAAARVWWMFRSFGHDNVAMLDGGYGKWTKEELPTEMTAVRPDPRKFTATFTPSLVRTLTQMKTTVTGGAEQLIDARGPAKFDGTQADVFPYKKLGHMPNAVNISWGDLIHPETGALLPPDELQSRFRRAGISLQRPIVTTCASGLTSCVVALALYILGHRDVAVYDGSWAEWGLLDDGPAQATPVISMVAV